MKKYILVIDEGTTGTRALIYDKSFNIVSQSYSELTQYTPAENMVEHDAMEIYEKSVEMCKHVMDSAGIKPEEIATIGITNQRATCVVWDKITGEPLYRAIVWQDVRTATECQKINDSEIGEKVRKTTGWTVAPVYTSMMIKWYIDNVPQVRDAIAKGTAMIGTIDTWLIWNLTGRKLHAVSYSNASIMGSFDLVKNEWYKEFLDYLGIPLSIFPVVMNDLADYGTTHSTLFGTPIPISAAIADQHAALFAQRCYTAGTGKITNGTGSFIDINIGNKLVISDEGLNTVIAWKIGDEISYALEGYESVTGSMVQWLRDELQAIGNVQETEEIANSVSDSNGVIVVPALAGLSAPFHDSFARGSIFGLTRGANKAHIIRATLEGIVYRIKDIINAVELESKVKMTEISIDGGLSSNNFIAQTIADMLDVEVFRPKSIEATSLGAAEMAAIQIGLYTRDEIAALTKKDEQLFSPKILEEERVRRYENWCNVVPRTMNFVMK